MKKPIVGDIVHYTEIEKNYSMAAIVTFIVKDDKDNMVSLMVMDPTGNPFTYKIDNVKYNKEYHHKYWSWPRKKWSFELF